METSDLQPLIEDLTSNIDDLEESLAPLLKGPLSHQTSKLPLLDQAKLYVLATYAIESILFSSLRLNGVDAKAHPVFQELGRVKEYFNKIKTAETTGAGAKRNVSLDKEAAGRFIKAGLAGNEKYDRERVDRVAREKAGAKRKLEEISVGTHTRFDGAAKRIKAQESELESGKVTEEEGSSARESLNARPKSSSGEETKKKKRKGHKAPKAANRYAPQYADLMTRDTIEEGTQDGGGDGDAAESGDGGGDALSMSAQAPEKSKRTASKPKSSKEVLESLLDNALEDKDGKKKRKRKKDSEETRG
jgi:exosome complex protein LRP1